MKNCAKAEVLSGQPKREFLSVRLNPPRMNVLLRKSLSLTASALIAALTIGSAFGQAAKVVGQKPEFDDLLSPEFSGGKAKSFKPKEWLEIEASLKVSLSPTPASKTLERMTVRWYIAIKNPEKSGSMLLLTKDVQHVNVPLDEDVFSSVYLSPASIKRVTGADRAGKGAVEYVGYEVLINGEKAFQETNKGKAGWWNLASDKLSRSETVPLLNKTETPFNSMWWDRYAEVSTERR
jgi:hypothetical protein